MPPLCPLVPLSWSPPPPPPATGGEGSGGHAPSAVAAQASPRVPVAVPQDPRVAAEAAVAADVGSSVDEGSVAVLPSGALPQDPRVAAEAAVAADVGSSVDEGSVAVPSGALPRLRHLEWTQLLDRIRDHAHLWTDGWVDLHDAGASRVEPAVEEPPDRHLEWLERMRNHCRQPPDRYEDG